MIHASKCRVVIFHRYIIKNLMKFRYELYIPKTVWTHRRLNYKDSPIRAIILAKCTEIKSHIDYFQRNLSIPKSRLNWKGVASLSTFQGSDISKYLASLRHIRLSYKMKIRHDDRKNVFM